jgi:hypothetical protein
MTPHIDWPAVILALMFDTDPHLGANPALAPYYDELVDGMNPATVDAHLTELEGHATV